MVEALLGQIHHAASARGADLVILGGARLAPYARRLRARAAVPVLEPVACAVGLAETLVRLGLRQSRVAKFAPPPRPLEAYGAGAWGSDAPGAPRGRDPG